MCLHPYTTLLSGELEPLWLWEQNVSGPLYRPRIPEGQAVKVVEFLTYCFCPHQAEALLVIWVLVVHQVDHKQHFMVSYMAHERSGQIFDEERKYLSLH